MLYVLLCRRRERESGADSIKANAFTTHGDDEERRRKEKKNTKIEEEASNNE